MVERLCVVDSKGQVDPASVEVVDATRTALGEAAKKLASSLDFQPGNVNGTAITTKVALPIISEP
jgi:protein TonB